MRRAGVGATAVGEQGDGLLVVDGLQEGLQAVVERALRQPDAFFQLALRGELGGVGDQRDGKSDGKQNVRSLPVSSRAYVSTDEPLAPAILIPTIGRAVRRSGRRTVDEALAEITSETAALLFTAGGCVPTLLGVAFILCSSSKPS